MKKGTLILVIGLLAVFALFTARAEALCELGENEISSLISGIFEDEDGCQYTHLIEWIYYEDVWVPGQHEGYHRKHEELVYYDLNNHKNYMHVKDAHYTTSGEITSLHEKWYFYNAFNQVAVIFWQDTYYTASGEVESVEAGRTEDSPWSTVTDPSGYTVQSSQTLFYDLDEVIAGNPETLIRTLDVKLFYDDNNNVVASSHLETVYEDNLLGWIPSTTGVIVLFKNTDNPIYLHVEYQYKISYGAPVITHTVFHEYIPELQTTGAWIEELSGDGEISVNDIVQNIESLTDYAEKLAALDFDFNENGQIDIEDMKLAKEVYEAFIRYGGLLPESIRDLIDIVGGDVRTPADELRFDGNTYVNYGLFDTSVMSSLGFCFEATIKTSASGSIQTIISCLEDSAAYYGFYVGLNTDGRVMFWTGDYGAGERWAVGSTAVNDGQQHQISILLQGDSVSICIDGQLDLHIADWHNFVSVGMQNLYIGAQYYNDQANRFFNGEISDVSITDINGWNEYFTFDDLSAYVEGLVSASDGETNRDDVEAWFCLMAQEAFGWSFERSRAYLETLNNNMLASENSEPQADQSVVSEQLDKQSAIQDQQAEMMYIGGNMVAEVPEVEGRI